MIALGEQDNGREVRAPLGTTVELLLHEPSGGGYLWSWRVPEGIRLLTAERLPAGTSIPVPGAGVWRKLVLALEQPGRHTLSAELARPWEDTALREFTVELVSEETPTGDTSTEETPTEERPTEQPSTEQPSSQQPPTGQPPKGNR